MLLYPGLGLKFKSRASNEIHTHTEMNVIVLSLLSQLHIHLNLSISKNLGAETKDFIPELYVLLLLYIYGKARRITGYDSVYVHSIIPCQWLMSCRIGRLNSNGLIVSFLCISYPGSKHYPLFFTSVIHLQRNISALRNLVSFPLLNN